MNALQTFSFESKPVRSLFRDDEPWFVGKDVCGALDIKNHNDALTRLDEDERGVVTADPPRPGSLGGGSQEITVVSEPGVYRLVFTSRTEAAERFKRWLAHEVLPALRRTGQFTMANVMEDDLPASKDERVWGQSVAKVNAAARLINVAERIYGPEAARALWEREKGLPKLGKLTVAAIVGKPDDDPLGCWKHLMRSAAGNGRTVGQLLDFAGYDKTFARNSLPAYGLAYVGTGTNAFLAIANRNRFLASVFAATQWAEDWRLAMARLPGASPSKSAITFGDEEKCRAVLIPRAEIAKLRNPTL